ncbi:MAG: DNA polymerase I [Clostridiales bacterium]|jgi:DNA polymerase-1|nr:DNA polymerase I [Clostridiales bacterium]
MHKKLMLLDANSLVNRAFYAIPVLTNKEGEFTNAVYGFLNIFFKLVDEEKPDYIAACFDVKAKTFRHEKYEEYKGGRKVMPEELRPQIPLLKNLLQKMNIKIFELEGFEADDIIGTLAVKAEQAGLFPVIVSGDKDLLQLASDKILVRLPKTKSGKTETENYYAADVAEKIGVTPREYIEVKALMGDSSDNIPGVAGIGEVTAVKIIQQYKTVENAILNAASIKPKKASENLITYADTARLSRELSEICLTVPVEFNPENCAANNMFNEQARAEILRLDFKSMVQRFALENPQTDNTAQHISVISSAENAEKYIAEILESELISLYSVSIKSGVISGTAGKAANNSGTAFYGVSVTYGAEKSVFFAVSANLSEASLNTLLQPIFESEVPKILLDSKKEIVRLKRHGISINNIVFDSMLAGYVLNSAKSSYNYDDIAFDFLNESYPSLEEKTGKGKKGANNLTSEEIADYAVKNSEVIYRAYKPMKNLISENNQDYLYYEIELPLSRVLADMEEYGIKVDKEKLREFGTVLDGFISVLQSEIYDLCGEEFNINSPSQLGVILFEKLALKGSKKTKTGYSTSADVLEKLANSHPVVPKILEYRSYTKLKSTYADGLLAVINPHDNKIHSTFNQSVTTTGRISSAEPNLQNIPIRLEFGRNLRKVFIPSDESFIFMDADYSQIELRVMAHMSADEVLIDAFKNDIDIHTLTASQVFDTPIEEVTKQQRGSAKAVNFGIIYGISGYSLSEDIGISKKEADRYIKEYFETYPQVKKFLDSSVAFAAQNGYAQTIFSRRRAIPEIMTQNFFEKSFGERVAMNMPVQGTAADIIKIAMVKVHSKLAAQNLKSRLILQVHDELLLEVKKDEREKVSAILKEEMENAAQLLVPLVAEVHEGENWYETK